MMFSFVCCALRNVYSYPFPIFNQIILFYLLLSSLCILVINSLADTWFANIFSHYVGFFFHFGDYFLLKEYVVLLISKLFKSLVWKLLLLVSYKGKTKSANISSKKCRFSPLFLKNLTCDISIPWTIDELWIEISGKHIDSSWKD